MKGRILAAAVFAALVAIALVGPAPPLVDPAPDVGAAVASHEVESPYAPAAAERAEQSTEQLAEYAATAHPERYAEQAEPASLREPSWRSAAGDGYRQRSGSVVAAKHAARRTPGARAGLSG